MYIEYNFLRVAPCAQYTGVKSALSLMFTNLMFDVDALLTNNLLIIIEMPMNSKYHEY